jgi:hypothetical protein
MDKPEQRRNRGFLGFLSMKRAKRLRSIELEPNTISARGRTPSVRLVSFSLKNFADSAFEDLPSLWMRDCSIMAHFSANATTDTTSTLYPNVLFSRKNSVDVSFLNADSTSVNLYGTLNILRIFPFVRTMVRQVRVVAQPLWA